MGLGGSLGGYLVFNVFVVIVFIFFYYVYNGILGTRCLLEKLGVVRSKDEIFIFLRVLLIFFFVRIIMGGRREL